MIVALIERDSIGGLKDIDLLKDRHALAFNKVARRAWLTAIKAINNYGSKSARVYCRSSTLLAKLRTWFLIL